jgi:hypothetical protein
MTFAFPFYTPILYFSCNCLYANHYINIYGTSYTKINYVLRTIGIIYLYFTKDDNKFLCTLFFAVF